MRYAITAAIFCAIQTNAAQAAPVAQAAFDRAVRHVTALAEATRAVPGAPPAMAVIAVTEGREPVIHVSGIADMRTGAPADADTPFYIASMTKAYVGLLAAELDRRGVLDLDSTLADHWPDLRIAGVDTRAMTLRNLLGHRLLFRNDVLTFRTPYTDRVPVEEYPGLLARYSKPKQPGFSYDNLGYLLYAAILEKKTGRSWQDWLQTTVFTPLGLTHTSARASDFPSVAAAHQWSVNGWQVLPPKADSLMHAAGGLVTSPKDMVRWLQANLGGRALPIPRASFAASHSVLPYLRQEGTHWMRDGYALGWNRAVFSGLSFLEHGGAYTGFRSHMMIAPDKKVAFAILTNSDSMTGRLSEDLMAEFIKALTDGAPLADPAIYAATYAEQVGKQADNRAKRNASDIADPKWLGWAWKPADAELKTYVGRYRHAGLGTATVSWKGEGLTIALGHKTATLQPAAPDVFAGIVNPLEPREMLWFQRRNGSPETLEWEGDLFTRIDP